MIRINVHYKTLSSKYPTTSVVMEFEDMNHFDNYCAKAERNGKNIIGYSIIEDYAVYYLSEDDLKEGESPSLNLARWRGKRYELKDFELQFNLDPTISEVNQSVGFIYFVSNETNQEITKIKKNGNNE